MSYYRKHIRLSDYDYSSPNYYFVTVCTKDRKTLFIPKVSEKYGKLLPDNVFAIKFTTDVAAASYAAHNTFIIKNTLNRLERDYYENLKIDFFCIMPDHLHIIIAFRDTVTRKGAIRSRSYKLSDIITVFKPLVTREIGFPIFQPNFYEHIIRSESSLDRIRNYILNNPMAEYYKIPWKRIDPN